MLCNVSAGISVTTFYSKDSAWHIVCDYIILYLIFIQYMPAAAAAPMQGTYIPQYTAVPASAITVEVRAKISCLLTLSWLYLHTPACTINYRD